MTYRESSLLAAVGLVFTVAALTWLFGPYGLGGCGLVLLVVALLAPERERRGEPVVEIAEPPPG